MPTQEMQKLPLHVLLRLFKSQSAVGFESTEKLVEAVAIAESCASGVWDDKSIVHRLYRDLAEFGLAEFTKLRSSKEKGSLVARQLIELQKINEKTYHKDMAQAMEDAELCATYAPDLQARSFPNHSAIKGTQRLYRDFGAFGLYVCVANLLIEKKADIVKQQLKKLEQMELAKVGNGNVICKPDSIPIHRSNIIETCDGPATMSDVKESLNSIFDQYCLQRPALDTLTYKLRNYKQWTMYVLRLVNDCWYVGVAEDFNKRFRRHLNSDGPKWTKLHKPLEKPLHPDRIPLCETDQYFAFRHDLGYHTYDCAQLMETDVTVALMSLFGRKKVRGGFYFAVEDTFAKKLETRRSNSCAKTPCIKTRG